MGNHARGEVHVIAIEVVALHKHITEVDGDAEADGAVSGNIGITVRQAALDFKGGFRGLQRAGELSQKPVTHGLEDSPVVAGDCRFDQIKTVLAQRRQRRLVIGLHQPAEAHDLRCHDGSEPAPDALSGHCRHLTKSFQLCVCTM